MSDGDLYFLDVTTKEETAYRAYQLRMQGVSWQEIAPKLGYKTSLSARKAVEVLIKKAVSIADESLKEEVLELELDRLDALQNAVWGMAISGDLRAVDSVLKIMNHRARLLALGEESKGGTTNTIVISGESYSESLRELTEK